jgi:hypothetical protein
VEDPTSRQLTFLEQLAHDLTHYSIPHTLLLLLITSLLLLLQVFCAGGFHHCTQVCSIQRPASGCLHCLPHRLDAQAVTSSCCNTCWGNNNLKTEVKSALQQGRHSGQSIQYS